jgi:DNA-binding CsgD family transcriptional regulator
MALDASEFGGVSPNFLRQHVQGIQDAPSIKPRPRGYPSGRRPADKVHKAERMARLAGLFADGLTLAKIAEKTNLSIGTVSQEIDKYVRQLEVNALESLSKRISRSEAIFRSVQSEALAAWFNSQNPTKTYTMKRVKEIRSGMARKVVRRRQLNEELEEAFGGANLEDGATPDGESEEESKRRVTTAGDPRFLQIIIDCEKQIIALRRLIREGGPGAGGPISQDELRRLSGSERKDLLERLKQKAQLKRAQRLALGEGTQDYIEAVATPVAEQPVPVVTQQEQPSAEEVDAWLL